MKTTAYFEYTRLRKDRNQIRDKWIMDTVTSPDHTEIQSDGRIRKWKHIQDIGKTLRVILLEDGETIHNAFFDRNFGKNK